MPQQSAFWRCPGCRAQLGTVVRGALYILGSTPVIRADPSGRVEVHCQCGGTRTWLPRVRAAAVQ